MLRLTKVTPAWPLAIGALFLACGIFYLFSYNSGYGFDGLEYLVIARSLLDGYQMYAFVPSKSPGFYALVASGFASGIPQDHIGVTALVLLFFVALILTACFIARALYDIQTSIITGILITISAFTMELNFLEPEGLVAVCGLLASWCAYRGYAGRVSTRLGWWFISGLFIGVGCCLKTVAAFYWLGVAGFTGWLVYQRCLSPAKVFRALLALTTGAGLPQLIELTYFALIRRSQEFMFWTYIYPFRYYPADTIYLNKLFLKCGWLLVMVGVATLCARKWKLTSTLSADPRNVLLMSMASTSMLSLLKSQASHYLVPSAVFLTIYAASIFSVGWRTAQFRMLTKQAVSAALVAAIVCVGFAVKYRPDVVSRFLSVRNYSWEQSVANTVATSVGPRDRILAFTDARLLYWLSRRYPPTPFIDTERQTTHWLRYHKDALADALNDQHLAMVEFDEARLVLDDPRGFEYEFVRSAFADLARTLPQRFEPVISNHGYHFWIRRKQI